ncbi:2,3,4,5-tetrahydropyridine-2,6-dicarboxylate N-acetyltransferase [Lentilactobacillus hilgardii]|uniref:2,3,4,5-tetrahydropyridine-2,6-dicarboxylate N-acetyltransferase n=1 Tax=Lentilactobacillus hilgardii (strain ATCC 8290 / DSM 20176 / CCUG 30140 / JCM 1155 / KCTC 3500 / NBRC 15886 / NCIMB 8040 / NRRL B-1843 / 9) TaxID=1423757 RepID=C0XH32_LENH9|nr:2,3,4,5-tetrahydropyridine-2,6-dicarboxylate N-acetyltransferase [Lentilactobacillus hilgardii]EEI19386.1 2,3,4,5-tetrahydropyridine-2,6-dicarboxylate N-acetyltransferase [Lentilactobacillus buchneri ATCC 11577]EEI25298.1 2,3,4,5-tetrahydropyridine-2,6-dicarboxylate N-acetyltransferase [Lentilactobacillus hilgardii DSM 20176 = ATCC 8290]KRK53870.1 2,3,4,5-tetrahydropyridine-2,6-dicarboxylate N-succinyltransferase [Lentilactobacillus hilgardii DSM 20176 = ATCC 8290]MCP9332544.1 2,3,4,5-tetrah
MEQLSAREIIEYIGNAEKKTPVKVYVKGALRKVEIPKSIEAFVEKHTAVLFGDWKNVEPFLKANKDQIKDTKIESDATNSAVPLLDAKNVNARIEPGAVIREHVTIGDNAVIMMGAIINIGAEIGADSMIDMGVVMGGRAIVGKHSHIGAGAVLAGVIEPASAQPVQIDDNVLIGANAVVIEGVHVGEGAVVAAGAVVTEDVAPYTMVAGMPAKKIKDVDSKTKSKTELEDDLRKL